MSASCEYVSELGIKLRNGKQLEYKRKRELLRQAVQLSLAQGTVRDKDVHQTKDALATFWVTGTTKATDLTKEKAAILEKQITKASAGSTTSVPLRVVGKGDDAVGEALAEKGLDGQWRVKYQPLEPEDPFDVKAYGVRELKVVTSNGTTILKDRVSIVPHDNILPATNYVFHDALTNEPISTERVNLNIQTGAAAAAIPMRDGLFPVSHESLRDGAVTLTATMSGYEEHTQKMLILRNGSSYGTDPYYRKAERVEKVFLRKLMRHDTFSATLRWSAAPRDLDLHCLASSGEHVYYSNKRAGEMELDIDVTSGHGPETMTVSPAATRSYKIYVKNYSGDEDIARSGATIELRTKDKAEGGALWSGKPAELHHFSCPTVPSINYRYWDLLTIHVDAQGKLDVKVRNELVEHEPTVVEKPPLAALCSPTRTTTLSDEPLTKRQKL